MEYWHRAQVSVDFATGDRVSNALQWIDLNTGCQDSCAYDSQQGGIPHWNLGPRLLTCFNLIPAWISNCIHYVATSDELQMKLQLCVDNVHQWYKMNRLTVNKKKSAVMVIGSKAQLQSLNLYQFSINLDSNNIEFVNNAKYLGLLGKDDLSWEAIVYNYVRPWIITFMSSADWIRYSPNNYCSKFINHMFSPNKIMDSSSGDVPLKDIWIVHKEFRISVLWLYVKSMILITQEE